MMETSFKITMPRHEIICIMSNIICTSISHDFIMEKSAGVCFIGIGVVDLWPDKHYLAVIAIVNA